MRPLLVIFGSLASAFAVLAACGGGEGSPPGMAPDGAPLPPGAQGPALPAAPIPRDQYESALYSAVCESVENCCRIEGLPFVPGACARLFEEQSGDGGAGAGLGVPPADETSLTYDPQAAGNCVAFYRETFRAYNEACNMPTPIKPPGQSKGEFLLAQTLQLSKRLTQLADPTACLKVFTGGAKAPGEPCTSSWECKAASRTASGQVLGASCKPREAGGPSVCHSAGVVGEGESCTTESDVLDSRFCMPIELTDVKQQASLDAKTLYSLSRSLYCDEVSRTCKKRVQVADGQSCADEGTVCDESRSFCRDSDDTCEPLLADGASCKNDDNCASGYCDDTQKCAAVAAEGSPCEDEEQCATGWCSRTSNTCKSFFAVAATPSTCSGKTR